MSTDNNGMNALARVLTARMREVAQTPEIVDFGEIQGDYSLLMNNFPVPIPASDYVICRGVSYDPADIWVTSIKGQGTHPHGPSGSHSQEGGTGSHNHPSLEGEHIHHIPLPEKMYCIKPGDRVLVVWAGNCAVVVDKIRSASSVTGERGSMSDKYLAFDPSQPQSLELDNENDSHVMKFTPPKTKEYIVALTPKEESLVYSSGPDGQEIMPINAQIELYEDEYLTRLIDAKDWQICAELTAGKTYYIKFTKKEEL